MIKHQWTKPVLTFISSLALLVSSMMVVPARAEASNPGLFPDAVYKNFEEQPITKGITHTHFKVFDDSGWLKGDILTIDLKDSNVEADLLYPENVSSTSTPKKLAEDSGAIAVVNGDFFDIKNTGAPLGAMIKDGQLVKSGQSWDQMIGITSDKQGSLFKFSMFGMVINRSNLSTFPVPLGGINEAIVKPNQAYIYNPQWGPASRESLVKDTPKYAEVVVKNNIVSQVLENQLYTSPIAQDTFLILGLGTAADSLLKDYKPGDVVDVSYYSLPDPQKLKFALSGDVPLVVDGQPKKYPSNPYRHPRTGMGFSKDGSRMYLVVVDGRQKDSRGMTYDEMGELMASIGAWNAVNLDSGGSSQMIIRPLAKENLQVANSPSDGRQRAIPNAVGLFSTASTGRLKGFKIETISDRVFSGLSRTFSSYPYDEFYNPLPAEPNARWSTSSPSWGLFREPGILRAGNKGDGEVVVGLGGAISSYPVKVLGPVSRIYPSVREIWLDPGKTSTFRILGQDGEGYRAPIEPRDISLNYDKNMVTVEPQIDGSFKVAAVSENGATIIEASVGNVKTHVGVAFGLQPVPVDGLEDISKWMFEKYPEEVTGMVSPVANPSGNGNALRLDYDFTVCPETRAAYIIPASGAMPLPGIAKKIGLKVLGDEGNGHWLRGVIQDRTGKEFTLDFASHVEWTGWRYVEAAVPSGVQYPVYLKKIYLVSTDQDNLTAGHIMIDDLIVKIPPGVILPQPSHKDDPMVAGSPKSLGKGWKFAVIPNLAIDSGDTTGEKISAAMETLSIIEKYPLDFVIFPGNIASNGLGQNYEVARQLIENSLPPGLPYYVLPGNLDMRLTGTLENFQKTFGQDIQKFDHRGTRFLLLNMATGSWRTSNPSQWRMLKQALENAKSDPSINNLVVVNCYALRDPDTHSIKNNLNEMEVQLLESFLTEFEESSGKPAAFISGQGEFSVHRYDGVPYIQSGSNVSIFGLDPSSPSQWLKAYHIEHDI